MKITFGMIVLNGDQVYIMKHPGVPRLYMEYLELLLSVREKHQL